jgi:hypothetical protein
MLKLFEILTIIHNVLSKVKFLLKANFFLPQTKAPFAVFIEYNFKYLERITIKRKYEKKIINYENTKKSLKLSNEWFAKYTLQNK